MEKILVSREELDKLCGLEIIMKFKDGTARGKFMASVFPDIDGYHFVRRINERTIVKRGPFFPIDMGVDFIENPIRLIKNSDNTYSLEVPVSISTFYYHKDFDLTEREYKEFDSFLKQEFLEFSNLQ